MQCILLIDLISLIFFYVKRRKKKRKRNIPFPLVEGFLIILRDDERKREMQAELIVVVV